LVVEEDIAGALEEVVEFLACLEDGEAGLFEMGWEGEIDGGVGVEGWIRQAVRGEVFVDLLCVLGHDCGQFGDTAWFGGHAGVA
jgi:hypothetical protein